MQEIYEPEKVKNGVFQAMMEVGLVNDGPVGVDYRCEDGAVNARISISTLMHGGLKLTYCEIFRLLWRFRRIRQKLKVENQIRRKKPSLTCTLGSHHRYLSSSMGVILDGFLKNDPVWIRWYRTEAP